MEFFLLRPVIKEATCPRMLKVLGAVLCVAVAPVSGARAQQPWVWVCTDAGAGGYEAFPDVCRTAYRARLMKALRLLRARVLADRGAAQRRTHQLLHLDERGADVVGGANAVRRSLR